MAINLNGLPWFLGRVVLATLANEKCSADAVLLMSDAIEEVAKTLPAQTVYREPCDRVVDQLRTIAPEYAK